MSTDGDPGSQFENGPPAGMSPGEPPTPAWSSGDPGAVVPASYPADLQGESVSFGAGSGTDAPAYGLGTAPTEPPAPPSRRSRKPLVAIVAIAAVALIGGGGAWAYSFLSGGGPQPDTVVPASAVAYASVDLDPSAGQKIAAVRFLRKFPSLTSQITANGDLLHELFTSSTKGDSSSKIDFGRDIAPWVGKRAAVAVIPPATAGGAPRAFFVVQVTNEAKARTSIRKLLDEQSADSGGSSSSGAESVSPDGQAGSGQVLSTDGGVGTPAKPTGLVVRDGYALIGLDQAGIEKVSADAAAAPLSKSTTFTTDMKQITAPGIASAWVDLDALNAMLKSSGGDSPFASSFGAGGLGAGGVSGLGDTGRLVVGVHVDPSDIELQAHTIDGSSPAFTGEPGGPLLQKLPADTTGALAVGDASGYVKQVFAGLGTAAPLLDSSAAELGIDLPTDLETLVGSRFVVAVGDVSSSTPQIGVRVDTTDPSGSSAVLDKIVKAINKEAGGGVVVPPIARTTATDGIAYGSTPEYSTLLAQDGTLGALPAFQAALPAAATADSAGYVNFAQVAAANTDPTAAKNLAVLSALGFTGETSGGNSDFDLRLVAH